MSAVIEQLYLDPVYWVLVLVLTAGPVVAVRTKPLGFRSVVILLLAQYASHAILAFGIGSPVALYCAASYAVFVVISLPAVSGRLLRSPVVTRVSGRSGAHRAGPATDTVWFQVARGFLIAYWFARIAVYPFSTGDLDLAARLDAQQQMRVLFFIGQVTLPAIAACMAVWLRRGRRLTWVDLVTIILTVVALAGSDSKASILPILLAFFGALEMSGRALRDFKAFLLPGVLLVVLAVGRLVLFFPGQDLLAIGRTMLYRIAANTDSLEYLLVIHRQPSAFPFAGVPALFPYISKQLGYRFDYPPGAWLYGQRYGDYSGYGPNSGPVLDLFGNIGWVGLPVVAVVALLFAVLQKRVTPFTVGASSILYLVFVDITLFDLPVLFWGSISVILLVVRWSRISQRWSAPRWLRRFGHGWRTIDAPLPRIGLVRQTARSAHDATAPRGRRPGLVGRGARSAPSAKPSASSSS